MDSLEPHQGQTLVGLADRVPASRTTTSEARVPRPQYVHARPFGRTKQRSNTTPNEQGGCQ